MLKVLLLIFISLSLIADEYAFDMGEIEPKTYEYNGYLRLDNRVQQLDNADDDYQNSLHLEGLFNFSYFYEMFTFKTSVMATYDHIKDKTAQSYFPVNELYVGAKLNANHTVMVGKESLGWGKGYFFNPVAFFDRAKDPLQPTLSREGYVISKYSYNKSFSSDLKNLSLDLVYLRASESLNKDYYTLATNQEESNNIAMRLYLLWHDTDIDLIYNYSDVTKEKIGFDFSKNIQTNFEVHGEYAKVIDDNYSYLLGIRYLTDFELTIISEYIYQSDGLNKEQIKTSMVTLPFIAKDYAITSISQKEPYELLYFSIYYNNMTNLQDLSQQNKIGAAYSFSNNIDLDFSYNINSGSDLSEFGKKQVSDFVWLRVTWNY
ncbi:hypothetical protein [Candidatus Sulfurimonas baltica]|uniref:Uncharacterized protein n=1 Tax=Candidatus Sulfurimonas baltica TaxID=2740404 RepID=A0A7S7LWP2_9BACT|nr:hypothetical protein [Candidatus Sulfurimonas baltica]QOY52861.1 hypothetical protein HUE88_04015 [Candidatus Sulfurimonas baltica]